jgi:hypothetical protein
MAISFTPQFHQEVQGHTGPVWHLTGVPSDPDARAEQQRLASEGCIVVWPAGEPGTGFRQPYGLREDVRYVVAFIAVQVAIWTVIGGIVAFKDSRPAYAALLLAGALPCAISAALLLGSASQPRPPSTP